jgi:hypothetical protein
MTALQERARRWVRVNVTRTQTRDLFYPCAAATDKPAAAPVLTIANAARAPGDVHLNGRAVDIVDIAARNGSLALTLGGHALVLPGENIVSLPAACGAREVTLAGGVVDGIGWGTACDAPPTGGDPHLAAAGAFLCRSLSRDPFGDGLSSLTAWDQRRRCVRLWSWYWTTGIVYEALAALADDGIIDAPLSGIERGFRARQCRGPADVDGSYFVRWDPDRVRPEGVQAWHAPNDAAYLGLHGLLVAHRRSGDDEWLEQADRLARWIATAGMDGPRLRVGWNAVSGRWDDAWHYIDAAWTPAFFQALAKRTGDDGHAARAQALARDTIDRFGTEGPFYLKIWRANGRHTRTVFARGMAWVLEGWVPLATAGADWLVPRIDALVVGLLDAQRPDGAWPYLLDQPRTGPCNKGTPAIACHLQRAARLLPARHQRIAAAVDRALRWCESRMDLDPASPSRGGIFAHNTEGAISTVRDIPVAFNYASAYYVLARREQHS